MDIVHMISHIKDFEFIWSAEIERTQKILKHIPDRALHVEIGPGYRTLGRLAWHITTNISDMMLRTGLRSAGPHPDDPVPASSKLIFRGYNDAAISLLEQVTSQWTDETLQVTDEMFGQKWKRGFSLTALVLHQVHHRGQMTVVLRQAGLDVPGLFGPAKQEWAVFGMQPPEV